MAANLLMVNVEGYDEHKSAKSIKVEVRLSKLSIPYDTTMFLERRRLKLVTCYLVFASIFEYLEHAFAGFTYYRSLAKIYTGEYNFFPCCTSAVELTLM